MLAKLMHRQRRNSVQNATMDREYLSSQGYASQYGQDCFVAEYFDHKRNGVFVDIGANDGMQLSNSLYLESELGWSGVAVEPLPGAYKKLISSRTCKCIHGCVSDFEGAGEFLEIEGELEMLSGLVDRYSKRHLRRIQKESDSLAAEGAAEKRAMQVTEVPVITFETIIRELEGEDIDFLSLDTEGGEYEILANIPYTDVRIKLIAVENNEKTPRIAKLLTDKGFALVATAGCDEIYAQENYF